MRTKRSISKSFLIILIVIAYLPVVILGSIAIQRRYSAFHEESIKLRKEYIEAQEIIVKQEVERAAEYIEWRKATARISEKELQKEAIEWFSKIRFHNRGNEPGILFVRTYKGIHLMSVSTPELIGKDTSNMTDPNGINTHEQFMRTIKNPEGGYAQYSWYNPVAKKIGRKKTFVRGVPDWQWYIGAGFWFDDINSVIEQKRLEMKGIVRGYVAVIVLTMLILLILVYMNLRYLSKKIEKSFDGFFSFFKKAATQSAKIDPKEMEFSEFEKLASSANSMIVEREQSQDALQKAFQKRKELEHIIDHSPAVVFLWRNEEGWPVEYVSENVDQFGYTADEFISGRVPYVQFLYDEDLQCVAGEVKKYSEEGSQEFNQEYRVVTRDGRVRWIDDRTWIRRDENGRITHYQGIILDITERKQAEDKLRQSLKEITALNTLGKQVSASLSLDQVVKSAIDGIVIATNPDLALLFLREDNRLLLQGVGPKSSKYTHEETHVHRVGECLCGLVVTEGKPIYSVNIHNDPRCTWSECKKAGLHSFVALPLHSANQIIGVLGLASGTERHFREQASFLEALSNETAIGLQNALLHEEIKHNTTELEERVNERTAELEKKTRDLERFNKLFVDRELRMAELKKEIKRLREQA